MPQVGHYRTTDRAAKDHFTAMRITTTPSLKNNNVPTNGTNKERLHKKVLEVVLNSTEFRESLWETAEEIRDAARSDTTEATIEGLFERTVYALLREFGLKKFHPEKEVYVDLRRHTAKGRTDSRLGALILEYKRPALLGTQTQITKATGQLGEYLIALSRQSEGLMSGLLTNGRIIIEMRAMNGVIVYESGSDPLDGDSLSRMVHLFLALDQTALTSENLIRDFCGSEAEGVLFRTARLLNEILSGASSPKTDMLRSEWEEMFRLAHEDQSQQRRIEERRAALSVLFQTSVNDPSKEYQALFALHTAYAIVLKLLAYRVVSDAYFGKVPMEFRSLAGANTVTLRGFTESLEDGAVFRDLGIVNLLEGDFFSWYCDKQQWTEELAEAIRNIATVLARYEAAKSVFDCAEIPDLFRELYQATVPRVVRSSFGEFYTPLWLAQHVLNSAVHSQDWRAIDPCCGSGTFILAAIARIRAENQDLPNEDLLKAILSRVAAIDLNPLSVLTCRIQYFIHICNLVPEYGEPLVIPVYLGDAASMPDRVKIGNVPCLRYQLTTLKNPINAILPVSLVEDTPRFMTLMQDYEGFIKAQDRNDAVALLSGGVSNEDRTPEVLRRIEVLTDELIHLEANGWNGIWARILSNFLTTACLGKFDAVIGNPPWIDWKNLPLRYRERIKSLCIDKGLFSGAGRTGGINLNICALISHVSASNWLSSTGRLSFLMPRELANQASYEGWRRLGGKWRFAAFHDWTQVGHPFDPVKEDFMTYVIENGEQTSEVIPVLHHVKNKDDKTKATDWKSKREMSQHVLSHTATAGRIVPDATAFTFAPDSETLAAFSLITGDCKYVGREGIEFYPQELLLFEFEELGPRSNTVWLRNVQVTGSKYKIPSSRHLFETKYLHPLVKGPRIKVFNHDYKGLIVAFPYDATNPLRPIPARELKKESPLLFKYYREQRQILEMQTEYSNKIRGENPGEFYGLARTGPYSFADTYVAFRDNSKWCATVVNSMAMPWGENKRFLFQNHAVSICERSGKAGIIDENEAHFVCAILNTPIVEQFVQASSDMRSFKIRPQIHVPLYDESNRIHKALSEISIEAHANIDAIPFLREKAQLLYLQLCRQRKIMQRQQVNLDV